MSKNFNLKMTKKFRKLYKLRLRRLVRSWVLNLITYEDHFFDEIRRVNKKIKCPIIS